jgi:hypothetical protein
MHRLRIEAGDSLARYDMYVFSTGTIPYCVV